MTRALRILYQATFLGLFFWLLARLLAGDGRAFPYDLFQRADPLTAAGLALAAGTIPRALLLASAVLLLTIVLGRFFCGWICPLGTLQQLASFLLSKRSSHESGEANRWRPWFAIKYYLLVVLLAAALFGSLHTGLLDPLSLAARGLASLWPALPHGREVPGGWLAATLFFAAIVASRFVPRLFCRALCPLGAFFGLFARFSLFRIGRRQDACTSCSRCQFACQGADEPLGSHRPSECMVCLNCIDGCRESALSYRWLGGSARPPGTDLSRRYLVGSALAGLAGGRILRTTGGGRSSASARLLRPPGAIAEAEFLARCVKCMVCQQACPTGAIQPAIGQAGVEGFWTPVLVPRRGACEFACTRCSWVCPTGALQPLDAARKTGYDGRPPVRIGTAFVNRSRCLPWAMDVPCIVCEEMCPTDPKAIWLERISQPSRDGTPLMLARPHVDANRCVGCGLCENHCPVGADAAIRVSSVGESRDPLNRLLLGA